MERGEAEFEHYLTFSAPKISDIQGKIVTEHWFEIEIGMNDHFDVAIYHVFKQLPNSPIKYDKFKMRTRYRIGEKNKFLFDPLLYFEYIGVPDFSKHKLEFKLIMAKDVGNFNIAAQPIFEFKKEDKWELEWKYAIGMKYKLHELLSIGIESKGGEDAYYIGPVISHGKSHLWGTLGTAFRVNETTKGEPQFQIRFLMGVKFGGHESHKIAKE